LCPLNQDTQPIKTQPVRVTLPVALRDPTTDSLGNLISVYRPRPISQIIRWTWLIGGALVCLGLFAFGGYLVISNYSKFGPVPATVWSGPWLVAGGFALLFWILGILRRHLRAQPVIRLYANGLCIENRKPLFLPWEKIDGIASGVSAQTGWLRKSPAISHQATLYPVNGRPLHLHGSKDGKRGMADLPQLVQRIKANLYPSLQSELTRMFRSGLPLTFGPVTIHKSGIQLRHNNPLIGTRNVTWRNVKRVTVQNGYFLVEWVNPSGRGRIQKTYRMLVVEIPNLELLLKIIDQGVQR
jgi:hypothetical protein